MQVMATNPEEPLHRFLATALGSEQALFEDQPLMQHMPRSLATKHYVELRKLLHLWGSRSVEPTSDVTSWDWPFFFVTEAPAAAAEPQPSLTGAEDAAARWVLWFEDSADLVDAEAAAQVRDVLDNMITTLVARERSAARTAARLSLCRSAFSQLQSHAQQKHQRRRRKEAQEAAGAALVALRNAKGIQDLGRALTNARPLTYALAELKDAVSSEEGRLRSLEQAEKDAIRERNAQQTTKVLWAISAALVALIAVSVAARLSMTVPQSLQSVSIPAVPQIRFEETRIPAALQAESSVELSNRALATFEMEPAAQVESAGSSPQADSSWAAANPEPQEAAVEGPWDELEEHKEVIDDEQPTGVPVVAGEGQSAVQVQQMTAEEGAEEGAMVVERGGATAMRNAEPTQVLRRFRLQNLQELRADGLISEQNFLRRQREILAEI